MRAKGNQSRLWIIQYSRVEWINQTNQGQSQNQLGLRILRPQLIPPPSAGPSSRRFSLVVPCFGRVVLLGVPPIGTKSVRCCWWWQWSNGKGAFRARGNARLFALSPECGQGCQLEGMREFANQMATIRKGAWTRMRDAALLAVGTDTFTQDLRFQAFIHQIISTIIHFLHVRFRSHATNNPIGC